MDYVSKIGAEILSEKSGGGRGVRIAVLDSGTPGPFINGVKWHASHPRTADVFGHATAIASILAGGNGIAGLCRNATLMYIPVLDDGGVGTVESVSDGIMKAIEHEADIINLSAGFERTDSCPSALERACQHAFDSGKTVVCAAGNDSGPVNWPAALETTISVGSSCENGIKTSFSSFGEVDFVAPGVDLDVLSRSGEIRTVSGTSFSAAIVSGMCAMIYSCMTCKKKNSSDVQRIRNVLMGMATDVETPGWDPLTGYGLISGKKSFDPVCMKIEGCFFGKIINKLKSMFCFHNKETRNGRGV